VKREIAVRSRTKGVYNDLKLDSESDFGERKDIKSREPLYDAAYKFDHLCCPSVQLAVDKSINKSQCHVRMLQNLPIKVRNLIWAPCLPCRGRVVLS
jgi:hypothetical protein